MAGAFLELAPQHRQLPRPVARGSRAQCCAANRARLCSNVTLSSVRKRSMAYSCPAPSNWASAGRSR